MTQIAPAMRRATLALALVLTSVSATPREARAQSTAVDEGRARFGRGIDLYKEGDFHSALAEFRAAYAAAPSFRIRYNVGQTLYQLQDYAGALSAFELYLEEGADAIDADRKAEVESDLAKLRPRVASLTLVANVAAAEVSIDDQPRGLVKKRPILVNEGRRRVSVTASGYQTETRVLDVAGAKQLELTFELKPLGGTVNVVQQTAPSAPQIVMVPKSRTPFYAALATTAALGGGTVLMALIASKHHADYDDALGVPNNAAAIDDARSSTRTTALVADVLGGATVLAAGLTVAAYVVTSGTEPARHAKATSPKPVWRPVAGPTSVGVVGTF